MYSLEEFFTRERYIPERMVPEIITSEPVFNPFSGAALVFAEIGIKQKIKNKFIAGKMNFLK